MGYKGVAKGFTPTPIAKIRCLRHQLVWGFTLVELMIVVSIIAILIAVALPSYFAIRTSTKKTICINNLRKIDGAVDQWATECDVDEGIDPSQEEETQIYGYIIGSKPKCPSGGNYTITKVGQHPQVRCNIEGHMLPEE